MIDIDFVCYKYRFAKGITTLFLFYPDGIWDEDKLTIKEALNKYPIELYNWLYCAED